MEMSQPLFQRKLNCPACTTDYLGIGLLSSKVRRKKVHSDFYTEYDGINPNYYLIQVCPHCGYAFYKNPSPLTQKQQETISTQVTASWQPRDYNQERSLATAIVCYKLSFLSGQLINQSGSIQAGILLHLAWLYRDNNAKEEEQRFLKLSLDYYRDLYENSHSSIDVPRTLYLIGELSRQLGEYQDAQASFRQIIDDRRITDATIIKLAREQYTETREQLKAERQK